MNNENILLKEMITKLILCEEIKLSKINLKDEENILIYKIIKIICLKNGKLSITKFKQFPEFQKTVSQFLRDLVVGDIKTLFNTYPKKFYELNSYFIFNLYFESYSRELLPFFFMVALFSFINTGKDQQEEIKNIQSDPFFNNIIAEYISTQRKNLPKIIELYMKLILNKENKTVSDESDKNDLEELKYLFDSYSSYNYIYCKDDIVTLIHGIFSAITPEIKSIYLTEGPEFIFVNTLIRILIETIHKKFQNDLEYYENKKINYLCEILLDGIKEFINNTTENNYAKLIIQFCEDNKVGQNEYIKIISIFFELLSPEKYLMHLDEKIKSYINKKNEENYVEEEEEEEVGSESKNIIKNIDNNNNQIIQNDDNKIINNLDTNENIQNKKDEKVKENIISEKIDVSDNSNIISIHEIHSEKGNIEKDNNNKKNKDNKILLEPEEKNLNDIQNNNKDYNLLINKIKNMENDLQLYQNKTEQIENELQLYKNELQLYKNRTKQTENELERVSNELKEDKKEARRVKKELQKKLVQEEKNFLNFKKQTISSNLKKEMEFKAMAKTLKMIEFRDISKIIINNYVEKHGQNMNKELKKKEKVLAICDKLKGRKKNYFSQLVKNYYNSNHMSHISEIFKNLEAKHIIGIGKNDDVISETTSEYINSMFKIEKEKNFKNEKQYISELFDIYKIVIYLYENYNFFNK